METLRRYWPDPEPVLIPVNPNPSYLSVWNLEKTADQYSWAKWHAENRLLAINGSIVYLVTIFTIRHLMLNRPPFQIKKILFLWNASLAIFSIFGFFRSFPQIEYTIRETGFGDSICKRDHNSATVFWGLLFGLSKMVEFGDTIFIVLRKKPLMFLHYYHHVTVLVYTWFSQHSMNSTCVWFGTMNYFVHSSMYSYYALQALQVKIPKKISMTITVLQLAQMVMGIGINCYVLYAKANGRTCATESQHVYWALLMYASYFFLFAKFFYAAYFQKRQQSKKSN